jgi:hypothetical protein
MGVGLTELLMVGVVSAVVVTAVVTTLVGVAVGGKVGVGGTVVAVGVSPQAFKSGSNKIKSTVNIYQPENFKLVYLMP